MMLRKLSDALLHHHFIASLFSRLWLPLCTRTRKHNYVKYEASDLRTNRVQVKYKLGRTLTRLLLSQFYVIKLFFDKHMMLFEKDFILKLNTFTYKVLFLFFLIKKLILACHSISQFQSCSFKVLL